MISITSSSRYRLNKKYVTAAVLERSDKTGAGSADFSVVFVGRNKMKSITASYKKDDILHPVLSFDLLPDNNNAPGQIRGEIFICYPQAVLLAAERNKKVDDIFVELILHGIGSIMERTS